MDWNCIPKQTFWSLAIFEPLYSRTMIYQLRLYTSLQKHLQIPPLNCPSSKKSLSWATVQQKKNNANETIKISIPIPFSPPIKGDSGPPIMGPPYAKLPILFLYVFRDSGLGRFVWVPRRPMSLRGPWSSKSSTWIQSLKWQKSKARSTSSRWGVQNHGSSWGARYRPETARINDGCKVSGLQSEITQAIGW